MNHTTTCILHRNATQGCFQVLNISLCSLNEYLSVCLSVCLSIYQHYLVLHVLTCKHANVYRNAGGQTEASQLHMLYTPSFVHRLVAKDFLFWHKPVIVVCYSASIVTLSCEISHSIERDLFILIYEHLKGAYTKPSLKRTSLAWSEVVAPNRIKAQFRRALVSWTWEGPLHPYNQCYFQNPNINIYISGNPKNTVQLCLKFLY